MQVNLGDKVRDTITGLTGIAVARTEWFNGCTRIVVQPQAIKDGKAVETSCFDEPQLQVLKTKGPTKPPMGGGDRNDRAALRR